MYNLLIWIVVGSGSPVPAFRCQVLQVTRFLEYSRGLKVEFTSEMLQAAIKICSETRIRAEGKSQALLC